MIRRQDEPADFCFIDSNPESRLTPLERLTLTGGKELEKAIAWMARQFGALVSHQVVGSFSVPQIQQVISDYEQQPWRTDPAAFFTEKRGMPRVTVTPVHGLQDGVIEDLSFKSRGAPHHPEVAAVRKLIPENEVVHARLWRHHEVPKGTIVAIHGWTMGDQRLNSLAFLPGVFYRLGLDVVMIELPYHGRRKPRQQDLILDPLLTTDGVAQGIADLRDLARYLRSIGRTEVGVVGMSLGGYLAALWASLDPLAFCVPIVPLVSLAEVEWELLSQQDRFGQLCADGLTTEMLVKLYNVHCPLSHQLKIPKERVMLIAGLGDTIVPARQPKLLWDHWKRPRIHWYTGGHVAQFKRSKAFGEVIQFLTDLGYASGSVVPD